MLMSKLWGGWLPLDKARPAASLCLSQHAKLYNLLLDEALYQTDQVLSGWFQQWSPQNVELVLQRVFFLISLVLYAYR